MPRWLHIKVNRAFASCRRELTLIVSRDQRPSSGNTSVYTSEQSVYTTRAVPDARKGPLETCDTTPLRADAIAAVSLLKTGTMSSTGSVLTQPANEKFRVLMVGVISVIITIKGQKLLKREIS